MNTSKTIGIVLGAVVVIGAAFFIVRAQYVEKQITDSSYTEPTTSAPKETINPNADGSTSTPTTKPTTKPVTTPIVPNTYTAAMVAMHNTAADCWTIVNANVYNLTSWISKHPGGQSAIKGMCGVDASAAFNAQHGGEGGPERILASYKLGALSK